jgi:hypothetical protein
MKRWQYLPYVSPLTITEQIKRKRYDHLLHHEGTLEYPDDLNYQWEWIDQKVSCLQFHPSVSSLIDRDRIHVPPLSRPTREASVSLPLLSCLPQQTQ